MGALQRESGIFLNNRATEAESAKKAVEAAAKDPNASPEQIAALQQQADDLAKWGQGGTYRQVMTALTAAASGNVTGSTAQFAQNAAVGYLQGLAANEVKGLADSLGKGTPEAETARAALHAIVGCAGAAAASQSCGAGAMGAATASVLGSLLSPTDGMTAEQKQARENAIQSLVAGVAGATGGNAATAMNGATFEIENNQLALPPPTPIWIPGEQQKPFQTPGMPVDPSEATLTGAPNKAKDNVTKPFMQPTQDYVDAVVTATKKPISIPLQIVQGLGAIFNSAEKGSSQLGGRSLEDLSNAGRQVDPADRGGEITTAGRALQKHGSRPDSAFPSAKGNPSQMNDQGQEVLDGILKSPGATVKDNNRFGGIDVIAPDGRGARFDADGRFRGFLEPPIK